MLDPAFIEVQTGDNGLYIPLTGAARLAASPNLHATPHSTIMRLDNHRWESFRTDKTAYAVFPYVPTPAR